MHVQLAEAAAHPEPGGSAAAFPAGGVGAGLVPSSMAFPPLEALAASVSAPEGVGTSGGGEVGIAKRDGNIDQTCPPVDMSICGSGHCLRRCCCWHSRRSKGSTIEFLFVMRRAAPAAAAAHHSQSSAHPQQQLVTAMPLGRVVQHLQDARESALHRRCLRCVTPCPPGLRHGAR